MNYKKINHYTWVEQPKGTERQLIKSAVPYQKKSRTEDYKAFCQHIFKTKKIISLRDFRKEVKNQFKTNSTWYIQRMRDLNIITEKNRMIKIGDNFK